MPIILYPFKKLILKIVDSWSDILWFEDTEIMKQRLKVLSNGFKDGFHCGKWILKEVNQLGFIIMKNKTYEFI